MYHIKLKDTHAETKVRNEKLIEFRKRKKLSQQVMSEVLGVSKIYLRKIENGDRAVTSRFLKKFKDAFPEVSDTEISRILFKDNVTAPAMDQAEPKVADAASLSVALTDRDFGILARKSSLAGMTTAELVAAMVTTLVDGDQGGNDLLERWYTNLEEDKPKNFLRFLAEKNMIREYLKHYKAAEKEEKSLERLEWEAAHPETFFMKVDKNMQPLYRNEEEYASDLEAKLAERKKRLEKLKKIPDSLWIEYKEGMESPPNRKTEIRKVEEWAEETEKRRSVSGRIDKRLSAYQSALEQMKNESIAH